MLLTETPAIENTGMKKHSKELEQGRLATLAVLVATQVDFSSQACVETSWGQGVPGSPCLVRNVVAAPCIVKVGCGHWLLRGHCWKVCLVSA